MSKTLLFASVFILYVLPRLLFFPSSLSRVLDFLPTPLSALSALSLALDAAYVPSSAARIRHRPPARLVPGRRLAPILRQVYFRHFNNV